MRRKYGIFLVFVGCCFLASTVCAAEKGTAEIPLLTAQDRSGNLAGWSSFSERPNAKTGDVWTLTSDGVLVCKGTPKGYIYTQRVYTNFVLKLQWRRRRVRSPAMGAC